MNFRERIALARLRLNWRCLQLRAAVCRQGRSATPSLVLLPCDPSGVIGSRGDEAMVYAILRDFRQRHPEGKILIVTATSAFGSTEDGKRLAQDFNVEFVHAWRPRLFLSRIVRFYRKACATEVYVLGADCMDGHYSVHTSLTLLAAADLATRMGIPTRLTGFSWNEHPRAEVVRAFRNVTAKLPILVRDPVSHKRFVTGVRLAKAGSAELVADVAFNLQPRTSQAVRHELDWMAAQRAAGRFVLGFNLHSMLVEKEQLPRFISSVIAQLKEFLSKHPSVALVLTPHDYRQGGDLTVLASVAAGLSADAARVRLVSATLSAEELKALAGGFDALFTSRMHLGIAALGMGKPIAAFAYQGKFAGLFRHFKLPDNLILSPDRTDELATLLDGLMQNVSPLCRSVAETLPAVLSLGKKNFLG